MNLGEVLELLRLDNTIKAIWLSSTFLFIVCFVYAIIIDILDTRTSVKHYRHGEGLSHLIEQSLLKPQFIADEAHEYKPSRVSIVKKTTEVEIRWQTLLPTIQYLTYRDAYNKQERWKVVHDNRELTPVRNHVVILKGLKPNQSYIYKIQYGNKSLTQGTFRS